jgi:hypothetical protein
VLNVDSITKGDEMKCNKCKNEAEAGKKSCTECLKKASVYARKSYVMRQARKKALEQKDAGEKRCYTKRVEIDAVRMQGMVGELEAFITNLGRIPASDYLEARTNLIKSIILRAKQ